MGKKAKFKAIRRLASQLPAIPVKALEVTTISGAELIAQGVTEVEFTPVDPKKSYKQTKTVPKPINHSKKMKKLYNSMGTYGVNAYLDNVERFVKASAKEMEQTTS